MTERFHNARMPEVEPWTCPSCATAVDTRYCPRCGERPMRPRDLTLRGLFEQFLHALTSIDGRVLRTFRCLLLRPGALTVAYVQGRRLPYLGPVALFIMANVLFFATESLTGGEVFSTPLESHLQKQPWSGIVGDMVTEHVEAAHTTVALYAPTFDRAVARNARSLIILMALAFALLPALVFRRRKRPAAVHAVFALHLYAFLLLLLCVATTIPVVDLRLGGAGFESDPLDHAIALGAVLACAVYLYFSTAIVYGTRGVLRVLGTVVLTVGMACIVLGYRFALFLTTLYTT